MSTPCTELVTAKAERDQLFKALLPIGMIDIRHFKDRPDSHPLWGSNGTLLTVGDIRTAARLTAATKASYAADALRELK